MKHGTTTSYCYWKCRCELCREAQRTYIQEYRKSGHGKERSKLTNEVSDYKKRLAADWIRKNYPHIWTTICSQAQEMEAARKLKKMEDRRKFNGRNNVQENV